MQSLLELCIAAAADGIDRRCVWSRLHTLPEELKDAVFELVKSKGKLSDSNIFLFCGTGRRALNLKGCGNLRRSQLSQIAYRCPNLKSVHMCTGDIESAQSYDPVQINFEDCPQITNGIVQQIIQSCPNLKSLKLAGCNRVTDAAFQQVPFQVMNGCLRLQTVNLSRCSQITDVVVEHLVKFCPELKRLFLANCKNITDASVQLITSCCRDLQRLDLSFCDKITDAGFTELARGCPSLANLHAKRCRIGDATLLSIAAGCPNLASLSVRWCLNVTTAGVTVLAEQCPKIADLDLSSTDIGDKALASLAPLPLKHLDVSWDPTLTDHGVLALLSKCTTLESLDLSFCESISDASVMTLCQRCPRLWSLKLVKCGRITDESLHSMGQFLNRRLRVLNLRWCHRLTSNGVSRLLQSCSQLETVSLTECNHIVSGPWVKPFVEISRCGYCHPVESSSEGQTGPSDNNL